ncbi:hypothetical protein [Kordia sp.]|uniref:hypothetical protein n=1 Tax=Kordia sp. TaxID=1965332 RepID=UPI003B596660
MKLKRLQKREIKENLLQAMVGGITDPNEEASFLEELYAREDESSTNNPSGSGNQSTSTSNSSRRA